MSTFNGIVAEFPQIRIDYFRQIPDSCPPLAVFLSHVHSDHLQGLESLKAPFIYCSHATRELLLKLEKFPHRMNFSKGILEARKQTYKHLATLLKPIPLEVPTTIELSPSNCIRVTLFDSNHCTGAVAFLIEGNRKAIMYTGDVRAEEWWVKGLVRHPVLVPYSKGIRRLDTIYLDTTFASNENPYRRFPSKQEGIEELIEKIGAYPRDTTFHFDTWTFGYEGVWVALSTFLDSPIHVDRYRWELYHSLSQIPSCYNEASTLCGFDLGNRFHRGCLTEKAATRIHSCERGVSCAEVDLLDTRVVRIVPIICRHEGDEIPELGAGGGLGDLRQAHELELADAETVGKLMHLCAAEVSDPIQLQKLLGFLTSVIGHEGMALSQATNYDIAYEEVEHKHLQGEDEIPLKSLVSVLENLVKEKGNKGDPSLSAVRPSQTTITFPYSRHSSYEELCLLVEAFKPLEVFPCTVDEQKWSQAISMRTLFGHLCSGTTFSHDIVMLEKFPDRARISPLKRTLDDAEPIASLPQLRGGCLPKKKSKKKGKKKAGNNGVQPPRVSGANCEPLGSSGPGAALQRKMQEADA
ncbi:MAG: hypothetical protein M1820_005789 [Bogoriella megaspora]|nr:MAG: hypothetical protein M1820_005789 [Bogoriella megaspora]